MFTPTPLSTDASFGETLKYHRELSRLSQAQLANYLGVDGSSISKWENGTGYYPGEDTLRKMSQFFETSEDYWIFKTGRVPIRHKGLLQQLALQHGTKLPELLQSLLINQES